MSKLIPNHRASNFLNYRPRNCRKFTCTYTRLLIMAHMKSESTVSNKKKTISRMMVARPACNAYFFLKIVAYFLFMLSKRPSCIVVSSCINPAEYPSRLLSTSSEKFHHKFKCNHFCIFSSVVLIGKNAFFFLYLLVVCWTYSYLQ